MELDNLTRLPGSPQLHRWADWAELLCLTSADGALSQSALAAAAQQRKDVRASEETDDVEPDWDPSDGLVGAAGHHLDDAELDDAYTAKASQVFEYLRDRAEAFGDAYPFAIDADGQRMTTADETAVRTVYLFLLVCACLRYVPRGQDRTSLASRYEELCLHALRRELPPSAEVHLFGKSSTAKTSRYVGKLSKKLHALADDLGERVHYSEHELEDRDSGDNGLDLVAWLPSGDRLNGRLVIFGQCACTPAWVSKQHSSSDNAWYEAMSLMAPPVNMCFIPYDFRRPPGDWYKRISIHRSVVVDRRRLLHKLGLSPATPEAELEAADLCAAIGLDAIALLRANTLQSL